MLRFLFEHWDNTEFYGVEYGTQGWVWWHVHHGPLVKGAGFQEDEDTWAIE